ncbi:MaoC/PaaZ C-terminal domain-containing protein [Aeromicrobium sp. Leaf350]|uniref:MaoC/PaaZ C-terminal domain-containing protein n=1 Tax=Aeromicrobium sp. Leaf350 TaxID=2876565 RepID=UPI001E612F28|nr:MaoC/PaaZ C-terminal domain-containing protein [Aeromicrobium sp. Leaf350]
MTAVSSRRPGPGTPAVPKVGDTIPPLERRIGLPDMVAYAGATWDWYQSHYDPDYVAAKKLPGPIVDGQVFGALLVEMLQDWLGPQCFVQSIDFTFRNLMFAGESVRCEGEVSAVHVGSADGAVTEDPSYVDVTMTVTTLGTDGRDDRFAVKPASARVLLGRADGTGRP